MKRQFALRVCLVTVAILATALTAEADLIYGDNGFSPYSSCPSDVDMSMEQAVDFTLPGGPNLLTGIHWWGHVNDGYPDDSYSFSLTIFAAAQGSSGPDTDNVVWQTQQEMPWQYTGEIMDPATYSIWDEGGEQYLDLRFVSVFDYALSKPLTLDPGQTYFLSIVADTSWQMPDDWDWCGGEGETHYTRTRTGDGHGNSWMTDWTTSSGGLAFYLTYEARTQPEPNGVVPEPATLLLVGAGLAGVTLRRAQRRN